MSVAIDLAVPPLEALQGRRSEKWAEHDGDVLAMTIAEMDFPLAPPVTAAIRGALEDDDLGYAPGANRALGESLAGFAERRLGWSVDPAQVSLIPDVNVGVVELCRALLRPGDAVAMSTPAYPPFFDSIPRAGMRLLELSLEADGELDLGRLETALRDGARAFLLVNPHNPTGRVIGAPELARIAELCAEHGAWVLADEIHAPLVLDGAAFTPFFEVSAAARECGIALTSASKAFNLAGLKAAQLVTASARGRDAVARLPHLSGAAGILGLLASEAAFREGDEWLDAVLARLAENRRLLGELLAERLPQVRWRAPEGTYLAWLDCRALDLGDDPAARFLARGRVALGSGPRYGSEGAGFVRLNFATGPELLAEGVERMAASL